MQLNKIIEQEAERIIGTLQQDYHCEVLEIIQEEQKSCTGTNEAEIGASAIINLLVKKEVIKHVKSSFTHGAHFALTLDRWIEIKEGCEMPPPNERNLEVSILVLGLDHARNYCFCTYDYKEQSWFDWESGNFLELIKWQMLPKNK